MVAPHHKLLEDMAALGTGILKDRHMGRTHSLGLMSQFSCSELPSEEVGRAQVKRDSPGMRGRTPYQTTRKTTKTKNPSIVTLYSRLRTDGDKNEASRTGRG